jgi:TolA-binding protein
MTGNCGLSRMMRKEGRARVFGPLLLRGMVLAALLAKAPPAGAQQGAPKGQARRSPERSSAAEPKRETNDPAAPSESESLRFASGLLRQRKYDLAAEEFERLIKSGSTGKELTDARYGLATARLYQSRYHEARAAFQEFLDRSPTDPRALTARYRVGETSYILGDLPGARRALESFTAAKVNHPGMEMAWTYLGDTCFGLKDFPGARRAYEQSLASFPEGRLAGRARYGLGRALGGLGLKDQALKVLGELAERGGPEWMDRAWLQIGLIRRSSGEFGAVIDAMAALERAAPRSPLRDEARLHRSAALAQLGRSDEALVLLRPLALDRSSPLACQAALEVATIELEKDRVDAALSTLNEALERFPKSPSVPALLFRSAEALRKKNRLAEARARFLRVSELAPDDPWADDALDRAVQTALEESDPAAARRLAGEFAKRFPKSPLKGDVQVLEARAANAEGKPKEAAAILESLAGMGAGKRDGAKPALPPALAQAAEYELALSYRSLGRGREAEAILERLAAGPGSGVAADARFLLGQAQLEAGRFSDAAATLERYLAASPQGDVADFALAHLAAARLGAGKLDDAWKALEMLARRYPRSKALAPTRVRLGEAALRAHQGGRAAEQFRLVAASGTTRGDGADGRVATGTSAAQVDAPLLVRALKGLGRAQRELGKPGEAAAALAEALALAPNDPGAAEIALERGRALEASGATGTALDAYTLVASHHAGSDQAALAALARARLLARTGRHEEGAAAFERLAGDRAALERLGRANVGCDLVLDEWGWALLDAQKTPEADRVFRRLLSEYPSSPHADDARFNLAESANQAGDHAEVIRLLAPLTGERSRQPIVDRSAKPGDEEAPARAADRSSRLLPAALYRLGRTQMELKDWGGAAATLERLVREYPGSPYRREASYLRGLAALRRGDADAAVSGFAALIAEPAAASDPPGFLLALRARHIDGLVALRRWKDVLEGAEKVKSGLTSGDSIGAELDYARGQALLGLARLGEARAAFSAVIAARRGGELAAQAQLMRGETYFHEDHLHEALREFLKVDILYEAPSWQAAALLEAGKVYERLDQWGDAAETYERLLSRFPAEASAGEARRRLDAARKQTASTADRKQR